MKYFSHNLEVCMDTGLFRFALDRWRLGGHNPCEQCYASIFWHMFNFLQREYHLGTWQRTASLCRIVFWNTQIDIPYLLLKTEMTPDTIYNIFIKCGRLDSLGHTLSTRHPVSSTIRCMFLDIYVHRKESLCGRRFEDTSLRRFQHQYNLTHRCCLYR